MARDEPHDAIRSSVCARELGAAPGVIEISRERRSAAGQPGADPRGEAREEHTRDAVPEARGRRLRAIVEETRDDDLVIGAEPAQDPRRLRRVPVVGARRAEVMDGLLDTVEHQAPRRYRAIAIAGSKTIAFRYLNPKKKIAISTSGPYPSKVRHEYACRGGRSA